MALNALTSCLSMRYFYRTVVLLLADFCSLLNAVFRYTSLTGELNDAKERKECLR
jgi:hypothetical protein